jgi:hypothetical protein
MKRGTPEHAAEIEVRLGDLALEVRSRAAAALGKYGPFASVHEAHSVLAEELDEIRQEVYRKPGLRSKLAVRNEALDLASVALRLAAQMDVDQVVGHRMESGDWSEP